MSGAPRPKRAWFIAWIVWALAFVVIEAAALLAPDEGDTLSESLRWLVYAVPVAGVGLFIGFFVWFIPHILSRHKG